MDTKPPNLADPSFEPTDEQFAPVLRDAGRLARWQLAMADAGIKVLALGLSDREMFARAEAWEQGHEATSR